jgi:glycine cleavage system transcriptional repressor
MITTIEKKILLMPRFTVFVFGQDQPGVAAAVARALADAGCNIEDSSLRILRGHVAMILVILSPPETTVVALQQRMASAARQLGLTLVVQPISDEITEKPSLGKRYQIMFYGADRPGLVAGVSEVLSVHKVNIVDIGTWVMGEPDPMYLMRFVVEIPDGMVGRVEGDLRARTEELGIQVISLDPVPAASSIQIKDVRLQNSFFQVQGLVTEEDLSSYQTGYLAEVKIEEEEQLTVEVDFQLIYRKREGATADTTNAAAAVTQPLKASASFSIDYALLWRDSKSSDLQAFAKVNAIFNAWPYWRQLIHSMLPSMGIHKLIVPVFRLPWVPAEPPLPLPPTRSRPTS